MFFPMTFLPTQRVNYFFFHKAIYQEQEFISCFGGIKALVRVDS